MNRSQIIRKLESALKKYKVDNENGDSGIASYSSYSSTDIIALEADTKKNDDPSDIHFEHKILIEEMRGNDCYERNNNRTIYYGDETIPDINQYIVDFLKAVNVQINNQELDKFLNGIVTNSTERDSDYYNNYEEYTTISVNCSKLIDQTYSLLQKK